MEGIQGLYSKFGLPAFAEWLYRTCTKCICRWLANLENSQSDSTGVTRQTSQGDDKPFAVVQPLRFEIHPRGRQKSSNSRPQITRQTDAATLRARKLFVRERKGVEDNGVVHAL